MPADPGSRHILSIQKLIADTNKAAALAQTAQETFSLAQMQALLDANTEMENAQAEEESEAEAARAAEESRKAAAGPFQFDLPADGAIAERPVPFRNTLAQIPTAGMAQAARTGQSATSMIQQRLRDAGVTPSGVPEALQGLPVAGDTLRQTSTQASLTPQRIGAGGFTLLPQIQTNVQETPNQLTVQDIARAREHEADVERAHVEALRREILKQKSTLSREEFKQSNLKEREQELAKLKSRLDRERDAAKEQIKARLRARLREEEGPKLSATAERQLNEFSQAEQTAHGIQTKAMTALRMLDEYGEGFSSGTGLAASLFSKLGSLAPATQNLKSAFDELAVQKVISVAQEAGARSADSDAERAAIASTAPSIDKDDVVNRRLILAMGSQAARTEFLMRAKQEHMFKHGSLSKFNPAALDETIQTVFNPEKMEIVVLKKEDAIPEGWQSISQLLQPEAGLAATGASAPAPAPTARSPEFDSALDAELARRRNARP